MANYGAITGPIGLWAYYRLGRFSSEKEVRQAKEQGVEQRERIRPFWQSVAVATTHCGAGCTLGDICAEWLVLAVPVTLFGHRIFGAWLIGYAMAFLFGIAFQFFTIAPMRGLKLGSGLWAAVKADALSLTAWQVGMYGWMAIVTFAIFNRELDKTDPVFWFMMQVAMLIGFLTSYPANWLLLSANMKEKM